MEADFRFKTKSCQVSLIRKPRFVTKSVTQNIALRKRTSGFCGNLLCSIKNVSLKKQKSQKKTKKCKKRITHGIGLAKLIIALYIVSHVDILINRLYWTKGLLLYIVQTFNPSNSFNQYHAYYMYNNNKKKNTYLVQCI